MSFSICHHEHHLFIYSFSRHTEQNGAKGSISIHSLLFLPNRSLDRSFDRSMKRRFLYQSESFSPSICLDPTHSSDIRSVRLLITIESIQIELLFSVSDSLSNDKTMTKKREEMMLRLSSLSKGEEEEEEIR